MGANRPLVNSRMPIMWGVMLVKYRKERKDYDAAEAKGAHSVKREGFFIIFSVRTVKVGQREIYLILRSNSSWVTW